MERLKPFFPKSHGKPRVDDRRVLSGIIFINRNGLRWCDAPREYGPPKTLYNRWKRWGDKGVFARMVEGLACEPNMRHSPSHPPSRPPPKACAEATIPIVPKHPAASFNPASMRSATSHGIDLMHADLTEPSVFKRGIPPRESISRKPYEA